MKLWAVLVAFGVCVGSGACAPADPREDRRSPTEQSSPASDPLPPGTVLRYRIHGGIAGLADELTVDEDLRAHHSVFGKPQLDWKLEGEDAAELQRLVTAGRAFASASQPEEGVYDGMSDSLVFAGRGAQDLRSDVGQLARRLLQHATAVVEVSRHPVVVVGEIVPGPQRGSSHLVVHEVLKSDLDDGAVQFAERLPFATPPPRTSGPAVWGLWLSGPQGRRHGPIQSWRHAPPTLKAHIAATTESSRRGQPSEAEVDGLALGLRVEPEHPRVGDTIRLHLTAHNPNDSARTVIRPRPRMLDTFGSWGGWHVRIEGSAGSYDPEPFPGGYPPVAPGDVVRLTAHASFEVVIDLERFVLRNGIRGLKAGDARPALTRTPGEFRAAVSYDGDAPEVGMQPAPRPAVSPPVRFTVDPRAR